MYSRSLFVPDFAKCFFVRYAQIYEAYVERTLIKFVYIWRKNSRKSGCKGDSESTSYIIRYKTEVYSVSSTTPSSMIPGLIFLSSLNILFCCSVIPITVLSLHNHILYSFPSELFLFSRRAESVLAHILIGLSPYAHKERQPLFQASFSPSHAVQSLCLRISSSGSRPIHIKKSSLLSKRAWTGLPFLYVPRTTFVLTDYSEMLLLDRHQRSVPHVNA